MSVTLIQSMGSDQAVVNAARVSFGKMVKEITDKDVKLIAYLANNNHFTPFTHVTATLHIKCPIFIRSQLAKHTVGLSMNEISRRYVDTDPETWAPTYGWRKRASNKKQGSLDELLETKAEEHANGVYAMALRTSEQAYKQLLEYGVCPEQARAVLPQSLYTEFYWTGSIAAFARVYSLRSDDHAQFEAREIAEGIHKAVSNVAPYSWLALTGRTADDGRNCAEQHTTST